jgi:WD40 repeat protein
LWIWDLASGEGRELTGHKGAVHGALVLPDGHAASWSYDRTVRVWALATGEGRTLIAHTAFIEGGLVLPDGRVLTWSADHFIRLRRFDDSEPELSFCFDATPTVVVPDQTGGLLVGDALGRLHFLEIQERALPP